MRIYRMPMLGVLLVCAMPALAMSQPALQPQPEFRLAPPVRRKSRGDVDAQPARYRRGKNAQAKPRKRSNRLTVSKRVRRKHRRAA